MLTSRFRGFTLIELMVVVIVIAVLAALALPSYLAQVRKSRRGDALSSMNTVVLNEERWRTNCPSYAAFAEDYTVTCASVGANFMSAPTSSYYTFTLSNVGANSYTVTATATGDQARDKQFGTSCPALYSTWGVDAAVNAACGVTTAAAQFTKCPAKCFGQ